MHGLEGVMLLEVYYSVEASLYVAYFVMIGV